MKKILLACFMAAGLTANAQYDITQNFDSSVDGVGVFGANYGLSSTVYCSGPASFAQTFSGTSGSGGFIVDPSAMTTPQTGNGQSVNVSVNYRKDAGVSGTLYLIYAVKTATGSWSLNIITSKTITSAAVNTCTSFTGTIPTGTLDPNTNYALGAYFIVSSSNTGSGNIYLDDFRALQNKVTSIPNCTTITSPANGAILGSGSTVIKWNTVAGASSYRLKVGTTSGGSDVFNGTLAGTASSQTVSVDKNKTYYASVTPSNVLGDASGCAEIMFKTNNTNAYCTAGASGVYEKLSTVDIKDSNGASVLSDATVSTTSGYLDLTTTTATLVPGATYTFTATDSGSFSTDQVTAYIDYNQNGNFTDAGEQVITTAVGKSPWIGTFTVPATATSGSTRLRVRVQDTSATTATSCGDSRYGQVKDFTANIQEKTLGLVTVSKEALSVYPNPFTDIVNISNAKNIKEIAVYDLSGKLVRTEAGASEINLSSLKSGVYMLQLRSQDGTSKTMKVVKK